MIYKLKIPINGDFYMDEPQADLDREFMEPALEQYVPGPVLLSGTELAEHEQEIQRFLNDIQNTAPMKGSTGILPVSYLGYLKSMMESARVSAHTQEGCLQGELRISTKEELSDRELKDLSEYLYEMFRDGLGNRFVKENIPVAGGYLKIRLEAPYTYDLSVQKKYEITEQAHPRYPWLHRIRSLVSVNEQISPGQMGGYVENEGNLSHDGSCWVHDHAICCEGAAVTKDARLFDGACARGSALVTGDSVMFDSAIAEGNCCVRSGEIKEYARVSGNAVIGESVIDGLSPLIQGHSNIYGTVRGNVIVKDTVLPGEEIINPTADLFILENGRRNILVKQRELKPPEGYQGYPAKKKKEMER